MRPGWGAGGIAEVVPGGALPECRQAPAPQRVEHFGERTGQRGLARPDDPVEEREGR